jgi:hypothetical protein
MKEYKDYMDELIEKSKGLRENFMTYSPHERKIILGWMTNGDPEVVVSLTWDKRDCVENYLGDLKDMEYEEVFYEDCDFEEEKWNEVVDFLCDSSSDFDLIWDILDLGSVDEYEFVNVGQYIQDEGSREEFFQYELGELIEGVYNHPLYKSYKRDMKLQEIGL